MQDSGSPNPNDVFSHLRELQDKTKQLNTHSGEPHRASNKDNTNEVNTPDENSAFAQLPPTNREKILDLLQTAVGTFPNMFPEIEGSDRINKISNMLEYSNRKSQQKEKEDEERSLGLSKPIDRQFPDLFLSLSNLIRLSLSTITLLKIWLRLHTKK